MAKSARPVSFRGKWRIRWFDHEGKRQSAVLDSYAEAETELRRRQLEATDVRAGLRRPSPADHTFNELCDYWEAHRAPLKRSQKDDESIIRAHLRPAFGALRLRDISVQSVDAFKETRAHLSPKTVGNLLVLLSTMFRQAEELAWMHTAPRVRKPAADPDDEVDPPWLRADEIERLLVTARVEAHGDRKTVDSALILADCSAADRGSARRRTRRPTSSAKRAVAEYPGEMVLQPIPIDVTGQSPATQSLRFLWPLCRVHEQRFDQKPGWYVTQRLCPGFLEQLFDCRVDKHPTPRGQSSSVAGPDGSCGERLSSRSRNGNQLAKLALSAGPDPGLSRQRQPLPEQASPASHEHVGLHRSAEASSLRRVGRRNICSGRNDERA